MSLCEALQYHHCALRKAGSWTVPPVDKAKLYADTLAAAEVPDEEWEDL